LQADTDLLAAVKAASAALDEKFGRDIVVLDIQGISVIADYFLIAGANSPNQMRALADAAEEALVKRGIPMRHKEGMESCNWALLDFGDVIVHLFDKDSRNFYGLERVWGDAKIIK